VSKKILITGTTAQQYSSSIAGRSLTFAGALAQALEKTGYTVSFSEPSLNWSARDLKEYKKVLIGISPPLSVTANSAYGALTTIKTLEGRDNLMTFIDAPEPWKIFANFRAIEKNSQTLFKDFYSKRKGYIQVTSNSEIRKHIVDAVMSLNNDPWATTLYPCLPWAEDASKFSGVPENASSSMIGINLDSFHVTENANFNSSRVKRWIIDNDKTRWAKSALDGLSTPAMSIRETKARTSSDLFDVLNSSMGAIIGPHGDKMTWWSQMYVHALNAGTPIATDWRESSKIGNAWDHLASGIEEMSEIDRYELSVTQKTQYLASVESQESSINNLRNLIGVK
jgi:hypothetical protein